MSYHLRAIGALFLVLGFLPMYLPAAVITVDNLVDENDGDITAGNQSLREAIANAASGDVIQFEAGLFSGGPQIITLDNGVDGLGLVIAKNLDIQGPGADMLAIGGGGLVRVFRINNGLTVSISNLTVRDGFTSALEGGGGILNQGNLTLNDCVITANSSRDPSFPIGNGGGISNTVSFFENSDADLTIIGCTINDNSSGKLGGGIYNASSSSLMAKLTIKDSTINNNTSGGFGGGSTVGGFGGGLSHYSFSSGTVEASIINSTFSGNSSDFGGGIDTDVDGGISVFLNIIQTTIFDNTALIEGGGISSTLSGNTTIILKNSIVAGNSFVGNTGPDFRNKSATISLLGGNIIGSDEGVGSETLSSTATDLVGTTGAEIDPKLNPLGDYGGSTQTHALIPGSPAIDAGENAVPNDAAYGPITLDQRGAGHARILDGDGDMATDVDSGAFEFVNVAPVFTSTELVAVLEDVLYDYTLGVDDPNTGDTLTISIVSGPMWLSLVDNGGIISLQGTPTNSEVGLHPVTLKVTDFYGLFATQSFTVTVTNTNDPPVMGDLSFTINEDTQQLFTEADFTGVFSDVDNTNDALASIRVDVLPSDGTLFLNVTPVSATDVILTANLGQLKYVPDLDFSGVDTFMFSGSDGTVFSSPSAMTTITVNAVNDPPVLSTVNFGVVDEGSFTFMSTDFTDAFTDGDGNTLVKIKITTLPTNGILKLNGNLVVLDDEILFADLGGLTYEPNVGYFGSDSFTWNASDGADFAVVNALVSISVNARPTITDVVDQTIDEDESTAALGFSVADVDTPVADLIISADSSDTVLIPVGNILLQDGGGGNWTVTVTPVSNLFGSATVTLTAIDPEGGNSSDDFFVTISPVNDGPVANDDTVTVLEGASTVTLDGGGGDNLLTNDDDLDFPTDLLTVSVTTVTPPLFGSVTLNTDGTFLYQHNDSENFMDSFVYEIRDLAGSTDTAVVAITITPVNDNNPVAGDDSILVVEGELVTILTSGFSNLLNNDTDLDRPEETLLVTGSTTPSHGFLALSTGGASGTFSYQHDDSENFIDSFDYVVSDGVLTDVGSVTIVITPVNDNAPKATNDTISVVEGGTATSLVGDATNLLANDSDLDIPNDMLTVDATPVVAPSFGILTLNNDGTFVYNHDASENFSDSFEYRVTDENGSSDTALVTITIDPVNDTVPVALDDSATVLEGGTVSVLDDTNLSVLDNDSDNDLPSQLLMVAPIGEFTTDGGSTITLTGDGKFTYQHNDDENLIDSYTYSVTDGIFSAMATLNIVVEPVNDNNPVAGDDSILVVEGEIVTILTDGFNNLLNNDTDLDRPEETLFVISSTAPAHGVLALAPGGTSGTFSYQHDGSENFVDSFDYVVSDGVLTDVGSVTIVITPKNDQPTTVGLTDVDIDENSPDTVIDLETFFDDAEDGSAVLTYSVERVTAPELFKTTGVQIVGSTLTLTYAANSPGTSMITIRAADTGSPSLFVESTFTVTVNEVVNTIVNWRARFFDPEDLLKQTLRDTLWGDLANADGDSLPNLVEYYMGLDPTLNDEAGVVLIEISGDAILFTYQRALDAPDAIGLVEWSDDLGTWLTTGITEIAIVGGVETETVTVSIALTGVETGKFIRLNVKHIQP